MKAVQIFAAFLAPLGLIRAMPASTSTSALIPPEPAPTDASRNLTSEVEVEIKGPDSIILSSDGLEWNYDIHVGDANGWAKLILLKDGTVSYSGHVHHDGYASYQATFAFAVKDSDGIVYTFSESGKLCGKTECLFGSSSRRDHDWSRLIYSEDIARRYYAIDKYWEVHKQSSLTLDLGGLLTSLLDNWPIIAKVIGILV